MNDDPRLDHRPYCTHPDVIAWKGQRGDPMLTCRSCRAVRNVAHLEPEPVPVIVEPVHSTSTPDPRSPRLPMGAFYVCPEHQNQPVNARGRGCRDCAREREQARGKKRVVAVTE